MGPCFFVNFRFFGAPIHKNIYLERQKKNYVKNFNILGIPFWDWIRRSHLKKVIKHNMGIYER